MKATCHALVWKSKDIYHHQGSVAGLQDAMELLQQLQLFGWLQVMDGE